MQWNDFRQTEGEEKEEKACQNAHKKTSKKAQMEGTASKKAQWPDIKAGEHTSINGTDF